MNTKHRILIAVLLTAVLLLTACTKSEAPAPANLGTITAKPTTAASAPSTSANTAQTAAPENGGDDEKQIEEPEPEPEPEPEEEPTEEPGSTEAGTEPENSGTTVIGADGENGETDDDPDKEKEEEDEPEPNTPAPSEPEPEEPEPQPTAPAPAEEVTFKNRVGSEIHGVYISSENETTWGDRENSAKIPAGSSITIPFAQFSDGSTVYDIGFIDENSINYDVFGVELAFGDVMTLSGNSSAAKLTVRHADGSEKAYDANVYSNRENDEDEITFENRLPVALSGIYISSSDSDSWGSPLYSADLGVGTSFHIDFSAIYDGGSSYDVGLVDVNDVNYDVFNVQITFGDTVSISGNSDAAKLTVRHADGTEKSYDVTVY